MTTTKRKKLAANLQSEISNLQSARPGRAISFMLTVPQFLDGSKDVTRRVGWQLLKPGDELVACKKCMGLKKGEKRQILGRIKVLSVRREPLAAITPDDCRREGFPEMSPAEFVEMFCRSHKGCEPETMITRIEFTKIKE
jgi:hypothetical protein